MKSTSLGLSFVSDVAVLLSHSDHDSLVTGATYDGGEDGARSIISGETSFAHARAIVDHEGGYFVVAHDGSKKCSLV